MAEPAAIPKIVPALSEAERDAVARLKYDILVAEMGRYRSLADLSGRRLIEEDDARSHVFLARIEGKPVGSMRITWGREGDFTERQREQYVLGPFLEIVSPEQVAIVERVIVDPSLGDSDLLLRLVAGALGFARESRIQLLFCDSEPQLLSFYQSLGFRAYSRHHVNGPEIGYLVPLIMVVEDFDYLRTIGSPLIAGLSEPDAGSPAGLETLLEGKEAVLSRLLLSKRDYWSRVRQDLAKANIAEIGLFDGMSEAEIRTCLDRSKSFELQRGYRLIKKGDSAKYLYMVLSGTLEVRDGGEVVSLISKGEVLGEIAFLLKQKRTMDVVAVTDDVKVVRFSEPTLQKLINSHSQTATKLLLNISRMLCSRLARPD